MPPLVAAQDSETGSSALRNVPSGWRLLIGTVPAIGDERVELTEAKPERRLLRAAEVLSGNTRTARSWNASSTVRHSESLSAPS